MVPENIAGALKRYIEHGIPPGSCTTAILAHDLFDAFGRADETTAANMRDIVRWIYNEAPSICHGSRERVDAWIRAGGMSGRQPLQVGEV